MLKDWASFDNHEKVLFCNDQQSGLRAIIAIHSTRLGPAAGGCRMFRYSNELEALDDVLRLSRAMTFKNALAGLNLGGGKSVIIGEPADFAAGSRLEAFGGCVDSLGGAYWTAEDVGVSLESVERIGRKTSFVFGTRTGSIATGDPSAYTARGVMAGLRAAVKSRLGCESVQGLRVAVQGVGSVGWELCKLLHAQGAHLIVADRNLSVIARARDELEADSLPPEDIHQASCDVFAPCALGGSLNDRTIPELKAAIVAGAANNSLAGHADGLALYRRGIFFAPDFVINAGGMMHASGEILGSYDADAVSKAIEGIYGTIIRIAERSRSDHLTPEDVAMQMASERLNTARKAN